MWELDYNKHWVQGTEAFELWCWRRLLRVLWTERRSNQSNLKEICPEYSLEGQMLKLKRQYFGHLMRRTNSLEKTLMLGEIEGRRRRGQQKEMVGWHHQLVHEFEQAPGVGDGQGSLGSQRQTWLTDWNDVKIMLISKTRIELFPWLSFYQYAMSLSLGLLFAFKVILTNIDISEQTLSYVSYLIVINFTSLFYILSCISFSIHLPLAKYIYSQILKIHLTIFTSWEPSSYIWINFNHLILSFYLLFFFSFFISPYLVWINFIFITTTRMTVIHYISTHSSETVIFTWKLTKSSAPLLRYSVTQSRPTLWSHGSQHAKLLCPSVSPGVCSNSYPLSQWCYLTISSSAAPFSFCLRSFPASGSFPMSRVFTSSGQVLEFQHQSLKWIFRIDFL